MRSTDTPGLLHFFGLADEREPLDFSGEFSLLRFRRRAMATTFEIAIPQGIPDAYEAAEAALDVVDSVEDQLTIYRDNSLVSHLNRSAGLGFVDVPTHFFELLLNCLQWNKDTSGAFDIASGNLSQIWGFQQRAGRIPTPDERAIALADSGCRHLQMDSDGPRVKFRRPGLKLNFGAVGKGFALDCAAAVLQNQFGIPSALISCGGSSVYAIGHPPDDMRGWPIRLQHPHRPDQSLGIVRLCDAGLGTSAATFQFFEYNGQKYGHVLDPRSGHPANNVASASVIAPTAAQADALSTAAFILGAMRTAQIRPATAPWSACILPATDPKPVTFGPHPWDW
ncbi:MAG: FAD:protein FMN transferase [Gemmataceae bacterium]